MKKFAMLMAVVMVAVFSASVIVAADAPEKIIVKESRRRSRRSRSRTRRHADKIGNCAECHHKDAAGKEQKCSGCHKAQMEKGRTKESFEGRHAHEVQGLPFEGRDEEGSDEV